MSLEIIFILGVIFLFLGGVYFILFIFYHEKQSSYPAKKTETLYSFHPISLIKFISKDHGYLGKEIKSYLNQKYPCFEVIFVLPTKNNALQKKIKKLLSELNPRASFTLVCSENKREFDKKIIPLILQKAKYDFLLIDHHAQFVQTHFLMRMMDSFDYGLGVLNNEIKPKNYTFLHKCLYLYLNRSFSQTNHFQLLIKKTLVERFGSQKTLIRLCEPDPLKRDFLVQVGIKPIALSQDTAICFPLHTKKYYLKQWMQNEKRKLKNPLHTFFTCLIQPQYIFISLFFFILYLIHNFKIELFFLNLAVSFLFISFIYLIIFNKQKNFQNWKISALYVFIDFFLSTLQWIMLLNGLVGGPIRVLLSHFQFRHKTPHKQPHLF